MKNLEALVPGLALVALRRISMERRHGNFETIEELYNKYMKEAEDKDVKSFYAVKYARYLAKVSFVCTHLHLQLYLFPYQ